jgi:hypothetical protein
MLKHLILLFNFIFFIIISALLPADIKITTKIPEKSSFVRDSTYIIEVSIEKGSIFGFAKFQQNIPKGFTAHPVQTADASFTFDDDKIKFIWMAIPELNIVKVSYALTATQDAPEEGFIAGKFSYIEDNERKSYDIPGISINIVTDVPVIEKIPAFASATRRVQQLSDDEYEVTVTVNKSGIQGFAKLEEYLPEGSQASVKTNNKAVFSQIDEKAKYIWMSIPDMETLEVSYTVKNSEDILSTLSSMQGNFSFLDETETKTVAVIGSESLPAAIASSETIEPVEATTPEISQESATLANETKEPEVMANNDSKLAPAIEDETVVVVAPEKTESKTTNIEPTAEPVIASAPSVALSNGTDNQMASNSTKPSAIPSPENGVAYKVQVVAGHKMVTEAYLRKEYKFHDPFAIENHEGWIKYTTGQFDEYKGARDKREQIAQAGHNFPGPFVTAYNSGERITVQEALMISNQNWFK